MAHGDSGYKEWCDRDDDADAACICDVKVEGDAETGEKLHHWHAGMDAIYAVGSTFFTYGSAKAPVVRRALALLRGDLARTEPPRVPPWESENVAELRELIETLEEVLVRVAVRP